MLKSYRASKENRRIIIQTDKSTFENPPENSIIKRMFKHPIFAPKVLIIPIKEEPILEDVTQTIILEGDYYETETYREKTPEPVIVEPEPLAEIKHIDQIVVIHEEKLADEINFYE